MHDLSAGNMQCASPASRPALATSALGSQRVVLRMPTAYR